MTQLHHLSYLLACSLLVTACKKLVDVPPPVSSITTEEVFADSADANSAILGIYTQLINASGGTPNFTSGALTLYAGASADELVPYYPPGNQWYPNQLTADNAQNFGLLWSPAYASIYQANAAVQGLQGSSTLPAAAQNEMLAEARFLRAFCYFYLTACYGDVPYVTSATNWLSNTALPKTAQTEVYQQIVQDLQSALTSLPSDFSLAGSEHIRATKWAALALLSKVYLCQKNWSGADSAASAVISSGIFQLTSPDSVFLANSNEAILQWSINSGLASDYSATVEGYNELPSSGGPPLYYLSTQLLSAFEPGDLRYTDWVDSINYSGQEMYYPYKYKVGSDQATSGSPAPEYYMALRLGEMYLVRAEADAQGAGGGSGQAIVDLNTIRSRANLPPLPATLAGTALSYAVMQERRIELFAEWGNRWFDLKRTGTIDAVMTVVTPLKNGGQAWHSYQQLYPIPSVDVQNDPNLQQNTGY
jgi:hypothetical protein